MGSTVACEISAFQLYINVAQVFPLGLHEGDSPASCTRLQVDHEGILHPLSSRRKYRGFTSFSDRRNPGIQEGTIIRNRRQLSAVSEEDTKILSEILNIPQMRPEWLTPNIVVSGIRDFSYLPRGTTLTFPSKAVLRVEDQNFPCLGSATKIEHLAQCTSEIRKNFVKNAIGLRGVLLSVDVAGEILPGDFVKLGIPSSGFITK